MQRQPIMGLLALVAVICLSVGYGAGRQGLSPGGAVVSAPAAGTIEVYFSPHGGCTEAVVRQIDSAKSTIDMQAYSFTSEPIAQALANAARRGIKVTAILDKSAQKEFTRADTLRRANIPVYIDAKHAIAHNKIILIDGQTVITGSFNFTKQAENENAENLLVLHNPALCAQYEANFKEHLGHSDSF